MQCDMQCEVSHGYLIRTEILSSIMIAIAQCLIFDRERPSQELSIAFKIGGSACQAVLRCSRAVSDILQIVWASLIGSLSDTHARNAAWD
jgi:hypothetical protein